MTPIRGAVLWPLGPERTVFLEDGVVDLDDASAAGPRPARADDPPREDGLVVPGFADWHVHFVQLGIAGVGGRPLLDWLRDVAWPEERRFADPAACREGAARAAAAFAAEGTLAGAVWGSPHAESAAAFLETAPEAFACGPAAMTAGEPRDLLAPVAERLRDLDALRARFGGRVAVTPRFALSATADDLAALGRWARERGAAVQTHLSENAREVAEVRRRFPDARDFLDVYERAGLVGPRTLLAHAVHVSDDELRRIAAAGALIVHCPGSNRALGSGRMPLERVRAAGAKWVLGSDVGAGPSLSMLGAMADALDAHAGRAPLTPQEAFHRATLGPAALRAGATEIDVPPSHRAGALVVTRPGGVAPGERDPDAWLRALLAQRRAGVRPGIRRAVAARP